MREFQISDLIFKSATGDTPSPSCGAASWRTARRKRRAGRVRITPGHNQDAVEVNVEGADSKQRKLEISILLST
jgi:hypothetical protein